MNDAPQRVKDDPPDGPKDSPPDAVTVIADYLAKVVERLHGEVQDLRAEQAKDRRRWSRLEVRVAALEANRTATDGGAAG